MDMETKYQVIPLFPTLLYINELPKQLVYDHTSLLDKEELLGNADGIEQKDFGSRSKNSYLLLQPQYENLSKYIIQHATHYAENYMGFNYKNYKFSQSWISVKLPHEQHHMHHHPHSLISGVLFYGDFKEDTSNIKFYRNDKFSDMVEHHPFKSSLNDFSLITYDINYKPNLLILFPSFLHHSVSKNKTNIPRKSLAFNVIPRDGFGNEKNLNELKFNS